MKYSSNRVTIGRWEVNNILYVWTIAFILKRGKTACGFPKVQWIRCKGAQKTSEKKKKKEKKKERKKRKGKERKGKERKKRERIISFARVAVATPLMNLLTDRNLLLFPYFIYLRASPMEPF